MNDRPSTLPIICIIVAYCHIPMVHVELTIGAEFPRSSVATTAKLCTPSGSEFVKYCPAVPSPQSVGFWLSRIHL